MQPQEPVLLTGEIFMPVRNYSGDSWYSGNWVTGTVETIHGVVYPEQQLRYNMLLDELFWQSPGARQHVMLDKNTIQSFTMKMDGEVVHEFQRIFLPDPVTGSIQGKYVRVLFDEGDGVALYGMYHKRFSSRSERINMGGRVTHVRILTSQTAWYLQLPDEEIRSVRPRNRAFINSFPDKRDELRQLLRSNNIRVRDEVTLIQAAKLINELHQ